MRITNRMLAQTTLRGLNANMEKLEKLESELTSGQKIGVPSDDPIGAAASLEFRASLDEIKQYLKNADSANAWLEATDSALDSVTQVLQRARELAVRGASDTATASDRQAIAAEVAQIMDHAINLANSTFADQYIFAGFRVNSAPFASQGDPPTAVSYNGDGGEITRQIDGRSLVAISVPGNEVFDKVFDALVGLRDDLNANNSTAISTRLADVDGALDSALAARSEVGARMNRVDSQKDRLESLRVNITSLLSKTQDVDMASAITDFAAQQNTYQAALAVGAKAIQPSLLDYLR